MKKKNLYFSKMINIQQEHKLPKNSHQCSENPHAVHESNLHDLTVSSWCAATVQKIKEPTIKKKIHFGHYVKLIWTPFFRELMTEATHFLQHISKTFLQHITSKQHHPL
jgi:hypothetical protein